MAIARPGLYTLVVVGGGITSNQLGVAVTLCAVELIDVAPHENFYRDLQKCLDAR